MRRRISYLLIYSAAFVGFFLSAATSAAGSPDSYRVTPDSVIMLIGDQRSFRMVDQNGHAQLNVTWTISNVDAFQSGRRVARVALDGAAGGRASHYGAFRLRDGAGPSDGCGRIVAAAEHGKKAPADAVATQAPNPAAATPTVTKPVDHAKKVITNDDIKSSPFASYGGLFYFNTGSINDCDANCFDQVRLFANQFDIEKIPNWRREVLQQIESVRSDSAWQAYLHQLYDAHNTVCT